MKFVYHYRTSDNVEHQDVVSAADRDAAYAALKARGIKPSRLWEAPGLTNKILGKGKRWIAIGTLLTLCGTLALLLATTERRVEQRVEQRIEQRRAAAVSPDAMPRHFVAGGQAIDLVSVFDDEGSRFLAHYAVPGRSIASAPAIQPQMLVDTLDKPVLLAEDDSAPVAELKRIVVGMKDELRQYLANGFGTPESYMVRLEERQTMEQSYREQTLKRYSAGLITQADANAILSAMGLEPIE